MKLISYFDSSLLHSFSIHKHTFLELPKEIHSSYDHLVSSCMGFGSSETNKAKLVQHKYDAKSPVNVSHWEYYLYHQKICKTCFVRFVLMS